eukprot:1140537-Pelagomonas_calceolata.AAC.2
MGGGIQPGRLANQLVVGHSQPEIIIHKLRHKKEKLCVLLMKEVRNNLKNCLMQQKRLRLTEILKVRFKKHVVLASQNTNDGKEQNESSKNGIADLERSESAQTCALD